MILSFVGCGSTNNESAESKKGSKDEIIEIKFAYWANAAEQKHYEYAAKNIENEYVVDYYNLAIFYD